jgi:hypothetical protein
LRPAARIRGASARGAPHTVSTPLESLPKHAPRADPPQCGAHPPQSVTSGAHEFPGRALLSKWPYGAGAPGRHLSERQLYSTTRTATGHTPPVPSICPTHAKLSWRAGTASPPTPGSPDTSDRSRDSGRMIGRNAPHGSVQASRGAAPGPSPVLNETLAGKGHDAPHSGTPNFPCCGGPHAARVWSREQ